MFICVRLHLLSWTLLLLPNMINLYPCRTVPTLNTTYPALIRSKVLRPNWLSASQFFSYQNLLRFYRISKRFIYGVSATWAFIKCCLARSNLDVTMTTPDLYTIVQDLNSIILNTTFQDFATIRKDFSTTLDCLRMSMPWYDLSINPLSIIKILVSGHRIKDTYYMFLKRVTSYSEYFKQLENKLLNGVVLMNRLGTRLLS